MVLEFLQSVGEFVGSIFHSKFLWSSSRHYWLYMLAYVVIAFILYQGLKTKATTFFSYLFPRNIYTHPSNILDLKIWMIIILIIKLGLFSAIFLMVGVFTGVMDSALDLLGLVRSPERIAEAPGFSDRLWFMVLVTLCSDFGFFIMHYASHKLSWLWAFHRVHHSAEVLTPITANRHHPVDYALGACSAFLIGGIGAALFSRYHGVAVDPLTIMNVSAIHFFYYMTANFRHSHIWIHFGKWGSRIFVSPAMHQIHHSVAPEHCDKNFGFIFSFWDGIFRTRYIPNEKEDLVFGLSNETGYSGFFDAMLRPFKESFAKIRATGTWARRSVEKIGQH